MELHLLRAGTLRAIGAPAPCFLIRLGDGTAVLVDTGVAAAGTGRPWPLLRVTAEEVVTAHLARLGVAPSDVRYVICTHLDPDHAGNHDAFPDAEFLVQRTHYTWARGERTPRIDAARAHWDLPELRYRLVDGDAEPVPGVRLVVSSGHVPGHQSVLVDLPTTGAMLLAGDAIPLAACTVPETRPVLPFDLDAAMVRRSTRRLLVLAAEENATVVFGHDALQWAQLRTGSDYYD